MSNIVELQTKEHIYDQASLWIAKLDRKLSAEEQQLLQQWLQQSDEHRAVLFEMAKLWDNMDSLGRLADLFQPPAAPKKRSYSYAYGAIAASFVFAAITMLWNLNSQSTNVLLAWLNVAPTAVDVIYETALGEHSSVTLPDGSLLVLNTNSRVKVKYSAEQRLILLEHGEINIDVAHNKKRPLSVMAGNKVVQAVGTAFNVRIQNDKEVELIVTDGKVLVAQREPQTSGHINAKRLPANSMAVAKGEKVTLGAKQEIIAKVANNDIAAELSWRQGNIIFRGEPLEQALGEISRYTSIEFEVQDESIKHERIAGLFKAGDINGLLQTLDQNFNIRSERVGNKVRLLAR